MGDLKVLAGGFLEDGLVGEARQSRSHIVLLAHLEVLAEVLVTAPPVQVDHIETLVTSDLMEVGVPHIVLDAIDWESSVTVELAVGGIGLTNSVAPVLNHLLLLVLDHNVEKEAAPQVEDNHAPKESDTVLLVEWIDLPVDITEGVFDGACNVLERSPSLGAVSWLLGVVHEFSEITISVLSQSSIKCDTLKIKPMDECKLTCQSCRLSR